MSLKEAHVQKDRIVMDLSKLNKKIYQYKKKVEENLDQIICEKKRIKIEEKLGEFNIEYDKDELKSNIKYIVKIEQLVKDKRRERLYRLNKKNISDNINKIANNTSLSLKEIAQKVRKIEDKSANTTINYAIDKEKKIQKGKLNIINAFKESWEEIFESKNKHSLGNFSQNCINNKINNRVEINQLQRF
jgi:hypothetical protein